MKKTLLRSLIKPEHRTPGVLSMEELDEVVDVVAAPAVDGDASAVEDEVVAEVEEIADESEVAADEAEQLDEGIEAEEELDGAVATMEALLADNGIPSSFELALVMESANDALAVWQMQPAPAVSMEALGSDEGRREAAQLALEDLKEKLAAVKQGVSDGIDKVKAKVSAVAERVFSAAKRAEDRANKMLQAVEAASGKEKKADSFKLSKGVLGQLSTGAGQFVDPVAASNALIGANKEMIEKFATNLTAYCKKGANAGEPPHPNSAALRGLPRDPEVVKVTGKYGYLSLEKPKFRGDRKAIAVPTLDQLKSIAGNVASAMGVAHHSRQGFLALGNALSAGNRALSVTGAGWNQESRDTIRQTNAALIVTGEWNSYQLTTAHALLSFVAAALKQYGAAAAAPAEGGEGTQA